VIEVPDRNDTNLARLADEMALTVALPTARVQKRGCRPVLPTSPRVALPDNATSPSDAPEEASVDRLVMFSLNAQTCMKTLTKTHIWRTVSIAGSDAVLSHVAADQCLRPLT
jgi:hypothetical protein